MKLKSTVTTRTGWDAHDLEVHDLGEITPQQLSGFLEKLVNEETLVVHIQLWNQTKLEKIRGE